MVDVLHVFENVVVYPYLFSYMVPYFKSYEKRFVLTHSACSSPFV